jgi:hypothetical protein
VTRIAGGCRRSGNGDRLPCRAYGGWTPKSAASFLSSLEEHAYKPLGRMRVDSIEASHIRDGLAPSWNDIPVMAQKVRQRIGTVLNFYPTRLSQVVP